MKIKLFVFLMSAGLVLPACAQKLTLVESSKLIYGGGEKDAPQGVHYRLKIVAPAGHREFKAERLAIGSACYAVSAMVESIKKSNDMYSAGDTLIVSLSITEGRTFRLNDCDLKATKSNEGRFRYSIAGKVNHLDIAQFSLRKEEENEEEQGR
jgi:hypothetical protein